MPRRLPFNYLMVFEESWIKGTLCQKKAPVATRALHSQKVTKRTLHGRLSPSPQAAAQCGDSPDMEAPHSSLPPMPATGDEGAVPAAPADPSILQLAPPGTAIFFKGDSQGWGVWWVGLAGPSRRLDPLNTPERGRYHPIFYAMRHF